MSNDLDRYNGMYLITFLAKEPALPGGPRGFRFPTVRGKADKRERKIAKYAKKHVRKPLRKAGISDYVVADGSMRDSSIIFHATEDQRAAISGLESDTIKIANVREVIARRQAKRAAIHAQWAAARERRELESERREFEKARDTYMLLRGKYEVE